MFFGAICLLISANYSSFCEEGQMGMFMFALYAAGCIFSGTFLGALNHKGKAITFIMQPASVLEKLLCAMFYVIVVFFVVYVITFYLIDIPFVAIANNFKKATYQLEGNYYSEKFTPYQVINLFSAKDNTSKALEIFGIVWYAIFGFWAVQAFYFCGSTYFKKFAFVKTLLASFVLFVFFIMFIVLCFNNKTGDTIFENYFDENPIYNARYYYAGFLICFLKYGLAPILYFISYYHIKEKEV